MSDLDDAARWDRLNLDELRFDDDLSGFDLSTLPAPGSAGVPLILEVDPAIVASLEHDAQVQGVTLEEIALGRLRGAA